MGMLIYFILTGTIGLILMGVGAHMMLDNWKFGLKDYDVIFGAVLFLCGVFAPVVLPLAIIAGPCYGVYMAWKVIEHNIKKSKENK